MERNTSFGYRMEQRPFWKKADFLTTASSAEPDTFERIAKRESYIFFMRRKADPNTPWYTLEVEPGGTVRQKRSYNNDQYADLEDAKPFIAEWQQVVQGRMTAAEIDFARQSKEIRAQEFAELKENGNIIRTEQMLESCSWMN